MKVADIVAPPPSPSAVILSAGAKSGNADHDWFAIGCLWWRAVDPALARIQRKRETVAPLRPAGIVGAPLVVEVGSHEDRIASAKKYAELYGIQASAYR